LSRAPCHRLLPRLFLLTTRPPPPSTLFPYTTLFRSELHALRRLPHPARRGASRLALRLILSRQDTQSGGILSRASCPGGSARDIDRKSTRLNSSHVKISYAVFCLKKKRNPEDPEKHA